MTKPTIETGDDREYLVSWHVDVYAGSERAAAEQALEIQRDPESIAALFEVRHAGQGDETVRNVDLSPATKLSDAEHWRIQQRDAIAHLQRALAFARDVKVWEVPDDDVASAWLAVHEFSAELRRHARRLLRVSRADGSVHYLPHWCWIDPGMRVGNVYSEKSAARQHDAAAWWKDIVEALAQQVPGDAEITSVELIEIKDKREGS